MSWLDRFKALGAGLMQKIGIGKTVRPVEPTYPRYLHVSKPITEQVVWLANMFGNRVALLNAAAGVSYRNVTRQTIKRLEREPNGIVSTLNNKQRRKWRAKVRKYAALQEAQA